MSARTSDANWSATPGVWRPAALTTLVAKTLPDAFCVDLWTVLVDPEPISGPRSYRAANEAFLQACSTSGEPCTMLIGFVLAWISGEGLHPPSLPLLESRRPKGHQQAQRSDIRVDGVGVSAIVKPFRRRADAVIMAVAHARSAAMRPRYVRRCASAGLSYAPRAFAFAIRSQCSCELPCSKSLRAAAVSSGTQSFYKCGI